MPMAHELGPGELARVLDHGVTRPNVVAHEGLEVTAEFEKELADVMHRGASGRR
jgi:hypothetical protein